MFATFTKNDYNEIGAAYIETAQNSKQIHCLP